MIRHALICIASSAIVAALVVFGGFFEERVFADASFDECTSVFGAPQGTTDPAVKYAHEQAVGACQSGVVAQRQGNPLVRCDSQRNNSYQYNVNPDGMVQACQYGHNYAKNNETKTPPPPQHPCENRYGRDADGGFRRQDACKQGFAYADGDYSKECGDMDANPLDQYTQICVEGYNLNPNKKTPYPTKSYRKELLNSAPNGYVLPGENEEITGSRNAQTFCKYYKTSEETRYNTDNLYSACLVGYEVGFGSDKICTKRYLFGANLAGYPIPNATARKMNQQRGDLEGNLKLSALADYESAAIAACKDGWTQYKVDYWYCGDNQGCIDALRTEKKRIIDPGPMPTRSVEGAANPSTPVPGAITANTADTTMSCGSVRTVYFSCGGGDGIENSSFWQILQIILNIMIALAGITAVGGIVYGATRYSSAGDSESNVNEAKSIIKNVIIGLVLFISMWAIIQYFIPGGLF